MMEIRRTYKYRLYRSKRDKHLYDQINIAGIIWNHGVALQRRYYRLTGKYIAAGELKAHIAKLRRSAPKYAYWQKLGSQSVQDVIERLDRAYQRFFNDRRAGRPTFQKVKRYKSFTLKQAGWKLLDRNKVRIGKQHYKFVKHREIAGTIKTVTIKRDRLGNLWICFSLVMEVHPGQASTHKKGGFDFGLKTFLTDDEGRPWMMPEYFKQDLANIRQKNRQLSRREKGSRNREKARRHLAKAHEHLANKRRDFHFKLAHDLCDEYSELVFEDLYIKAMQMMWGRKVSDLGFAQFLEIVRSVAPMRGVQVKFIDRWEPTSQTCSACTHRQTMPLKERTFVCQNPDCNLVIGRDHNAARNILRVGTSTLAEGR
jgi:putative transposase